MAHISSVGGVNPCVLAGRTLINDIRYSIAKGRTLIGDTRCDIEFGIPLGDLPVGEPVLMNVDGVETEFLVVNQGIPKDTVWKSGNSTDSYSNDVYDDSVNGTWLLMKDVYCLHNWVAASDYLSSDIPAVLEEFLSKLDVQDDVMLVNLPAGQDKTVQAKAFLLSLPECGLIGLSMYDGTCLDYFQDDGNYVVSGNAQYVNNDERIAYFNGEPCSWSTRSIPFGSDGDAGAVDVDGYPGLCHHSGQFGIRPVLIMPFETRVGKTSGRIIVPSAKKQYDPVFENNTWEDIIEACQSGIIPLTWKVGDSKVMKIGGTEYQIDIIGKYHDRYTNSAIGFGYAPLTLQLHDCYSQKYKMHDTSGSRVFLSWSASDMRNKHLPAILAVMPQAVQNAVKEVRKANRVVGSEVNDETNDKLFLLAESEIHGDVSFSLGLEGSQYAYYAEGNSKIKRVQGTAAFWSARSPVASNVACVAFTNGDPANYHVGNEAGVSFAFCF